MHGDADENHWVSIKIASTSYTLPFPKENRTYIQHLATIIEQQLIDLSTQETLKNKNTEILLVIALLLQTDTIEEYKKKNIEGFLESTRQRLYALENKIKKAVDPEETQKKML